MYTLYLTTNMKVKFIDSEVGGIKLTERSAKRKIKRSENYQVKFVLVLTETRDRLLRLFSPMLGHSSQIQEEETLIGAGFTGDERSFKFDSDSCRDKFGYDRPNDPKAPDEVEMNHAETEALKLEIRQAVQAWANS